MGAIVAYAAPDQHACTLKVSRSANLSELEADVDATLFPGASSDLRPGNPANGRERVFVIGTRGAAKKSISGKYVTRALQADTDYFFQISCPSTGDVYPASATDWNSFHTSNIPLGNTYNDPPPADPENPGAYAFPDLDYTSRAASVVDPVTGLGVKPVSFPGDMWSSPVSVTFQSAYNSGSKLCTDGAWTNPCGAVDAVDPAARVTNQTEWLILRPDVINAGTGTPYYADVSSSIDYLELSLTGSADSAAPLYRTVEICLSIDGGVTCATSLRELTFDQGTYGTKILAPLPSTNGTFGADPWLSLGKVSIPYMNTYFGSVTVNGADVTLRPALYNGENTFFHTDWKSGSRIQLTNNMPAATGTGQSGGGLAPNTNYYVKVVAEYPNATFSDATEKRFTTGASETSLALSWPASAGALQYRVYVGTAANAENSYFVSTASSYTLSSATGTTGSVPPPSYAECTIGHIESGKELTLQDPACITNANFSAADMNVYRAQNFVVMVRRKAIDASRPADGVSLQYASMRFIGSADGSWPSTGGTIVCSRIRVDDGYYCGIPIGNGSFTMLYWISAETGEAVPLGRMSTNTKPSGDTEDRWYSSQACGPTWDNTKSIPTFNCLVNTNSGKKLILRGELLPCPGNPCFSHAAPAAGWNGSSSLGVGSATWGDYSITYPNGIRWTILNPPSLGQDLVSQMKAIDSKYDEVNFSSIGLSSAQNGYTLFVAHHGKQDTISYVGAFSPGDGDPTHAGQPQGPRVSGLMNTWSGDPKCRWCTRHSMLQAGDSDYAIIEANAGIYTTTDWGGGPWQVTTNTAIPNDTGNCPPNAFGATDCISLNINAKLPLVYPDGDPRNYEPYDPNPGAGETEYTGPGALATAKAGDLVCVSNTTTCNFVTTPWNEVMRLIQKSGSTWIFQRNSTYGNNTKKAILGTGTKYLFFTCTAINPTRPGVQGGVTYWHFTADPLGQNTEIDLYNYGAHQVFRPGVLYRGLEQLSTQ